MLVQPFNLPLPSMVAHARCVYTCSILTVDVGGLTYVARWVRSDSLTDRTEEFDNWCKESDDGAEENTNESQ